MLTKTLSAIFISILLGLSAAAQENPQPGSAPPAATGKPQYGSWGFDLAAADRATKPGDDFFRFASGKWIDATQIPPDKPAYSLRLAMTDLTEQRLHQLMEALSKSNDAA